MTIWRVPPGNMLAWRGWDDEFLVYNTASGQTHHLNFLAGEALRSLVAEPGRRANWSVAWRTNSRSRRTAPHCR